MLLSDCMELNGIPHVQNCETLPFVCTDGHLSLTFKLFSLAIATRGTKRGVLDYMGSLFTVWR